MNRIWSLVEVEFDYAYFGSWPPVRIKCYSDGMLIFKLAGRSTEIPEAQLEDREHSISKKSLDKLDKLVEMIPGIKKLEGDIIMDGPSFACHVYMGDGTVTGFHYCSMQLSDEFEQLEKSLRQILREGFFLKKHQDQLASLAGVIFPD